MKKVSDFMRKLCKQVFLVKSRAYICQDLVCITHGLQRLMPIISCTVYVYVWQAMHNMRFAFMRMLSMNTSSNQPYLEQQKHLKITNSSNKMGVIFTRPSIYSWGGY